MQRVPEPELMNDEEQVEAYAHADFSESHGNLIACFRRLYGQTEPRGAIADLGCGAGDMTFRLAQLFPSHRVDGIDAAARMLDYARRRATAADLGARVQFIQAYLPDCPLPAGGYDLIFSNSLLHHLRHPAVLWDTIQCLAAADAFWFVADLLRPESHTQVQELVERYAGDEPPVLQRDFANSLLAAYRREEVEAQMQAAGLTGARVERVSDRHWIAFGRCTTRPVVPGAP